MCIIPRRQTPPGKRPESPMHHSSSIFAVGCVLSLAACGYRAKPLDVAGIQRELEGLRLESITLQRSRQTDSSRDFDYSDGLSADEAAAVALALNPELRARRAEQGIANAQLLEAGLLPNPDLDARVLFNGVTSSEATLLFDLTDALIARGPRKARATRRLEEVRWSIATDEWAVVNETRRAWIDVAIAAEGTALQERNLALLLETAQVASARQAQGEGTELDVVQAQADSANARILVYRRRGEHDLALRRLNGLLGLTPSHVTRLQDPATALALTPFQADINVAVAALPSRRPDLRAAEAAYGVSEADLRLAYRLRIPRLRFGPSLDDGESGASVGIGIGLEVPIFNRGQAAIRERDERREQARQAYVSRLLRAQEEVYEAWIGATTASTELATWMTEVLPRLNREVELVQASLQAGEIDLFRVLTSQGRLVSSRVQYLERLRDQLHAINRWNEAVGPAWALPGLGDP